MRISYAITVCNELEELKRLVKLLLENKRNEDEIVILFDKKNGTPEVWSYLQKAKIDKVHASTFKNHFADWKNKLTDNCNGDYIFQIDADELPALTLIEILPGLIEANEGTEVLLVPRINTVEGLNKEHIAKWRWRVNEDNGWVNWPDYQWRIWQNKKEIKWVNKVHEKLEGFKAYAPLPASPTYALEHHKDIKKQVKQNNYYDTL